MLALHNMSHGNALRNKESSRRTRYSKDKDGKKEEDDDKEPPKEPTLEKSCIDKYVESTCYLWHSIPKAFEECKIYGEA